MAEFPALPLFTDAFIGDTTHLTAAQTGAYLMLLMTAWRRPSCALPDDDEKLYKWARMDRRTWARQKAEIMAFWRLGADGCWRQGRLTDERKHVDDVRSKNAKAGIASALKRKGRHSTGVKPNRNVTSTPTPTPTESISYEIDSPPVAPLERLTPETTDARPQRRKSSTRISDDFSPDIASLEVCAQHGLEADGVTREFIDYWKGRGDTRADWQATFRNRVRQLAQHRAERQQRAAGQRPGVTDVTGAALRVAAFRSQNRG